MQVEKKDKGILVYAPVAGVAALGRAEADASKIANELLNDVSERTSKNSTDLL